jgi:hypothetical protein
VILRRRARLSRRRGSSARIENPELCRVWLMQLLASPDPSGDKFGREYHGSLETFA